MTIRVSLSVCVIVEIGFDRVVVVILIPNLIRVNILHIIFPTIIIPILSIQEIRIPTSLTKARIPRRQNRRSYTPNKSVPTLQVVP